MGKPGCIVCKIAGLLTIIGAINWGLVGAFNKNLVDKLLGAGSQAARIVYILVGMSGLMLVIGCLFKCPMCKSSCGAPK